MGLVGEPPDVIHFKLFGNNPSIVDSDTLIWNVGSTYSYLADPSSSQPVFLSSTDSNDTAIGDGAEHGRIVGVNSGFELIFADQGLEGLVQQRMVQAEFYRVFLLDISSVGMMGTNQGTIFCGTSGSVDGVPSTILAAALPSDGHSIACHFTCPGSYTGKINNFWATLGRAAQEAEVSIWIRENGGGFNVFDRRQLFQNNFSHQYQKPIIFPPKSDVEVRAARVSSAIPTAISAGLEIQIEYFT